MCTGRRGSILPRGSAHLAQRDNGVPRPSHEASAHADATTIDGVAISKLLVACPTGLRMLFAQVMPVSLGLRLWRCFYAHGIQNNIDVRFGLSPRGFVATANTVGHVQMSIYL